MVDLAEKRRRWREYSARHYQKNREACLARMRALAQRKRDAETLGRVEELRRIGIVVNDPAAACASQRSFEATIARHTFRTRAASLGLALPFDHWAMVDVVQNPKT
jgi:hypothetical protein